ncbi:GTPase [Helicobacter labacensis]|nr:GTPase [Helicobacter labacensis]
MEQRDNPEVTIALFGETNAGKSTLIEALRLFFKEKSKVAAQEAFKKNQA